VRLILPSLLVTVLLFAGAALAQTPEESPSPTPTATATPAQPETNPSPETSPAAADSPVPETTPAAAVPSPRPAATPVPVPSPAVAEATYDDGLRDGRVDGGLTHLFGEESGRHVELQNDEYRRGYQEGYQYVLKRRRAGFAVSCGIVLVAVLLTSLAYSQSKQNGQSEIGPLLRF
jgi:hypothetical protein